MFRDCPCVYILSNIIVPQHFVQSASIHNIVYNTEYQSCIGDRHVFMSVDSQSLLWPIVERHGSERVADHLLNHIQLSTIQQLAWRDLRYLRLYCIRRASLSGSLDLFQRFFTFVYLRDGTGRQLSMKYPYENNTPGPGIQ